MLLSRPICHTRPLTHRQPIPVRLRTSVTTRSVGKDDACGLPREETPEEALQRRLRESERVEQRVVDVYSEEDLERELGAAGDKLVVVEIQADDVCETGLPEEAELHWEMDKEALRQERLATCKQIKHVFQRTARDCADVHFVSVMADADGGCGLCERLGVEVLPTLQFYRNGVKLWEHRGLTQAEQDLGEGVLFYGDAAGKGVKGTDFVKELSCPDDMEAFVKGQAPNILTVVNVALLNATPCVRIFPAVVALAKNFKGHAVFGRLIGDALGCDDPDGMKRTMARYHILEVPTFLFFRNGMEVGRYVGGSRGDLIGHILQQQAAAGIRPPPPPPGAKKVARKGAAPPPPPPQRKVSAWR